MFEIGPLVYGEIPCYNVTVHRARTGVEEAVAAAYVKRGEYELAQGPVRRQWELAPWQEEAYRR